MKILTYNVNGIRSALSKDLLQFLKDENADIVCFQEIKAEKSQLDLTLFENLGYSYQEWFSAEKKGYSGVAILSKHKPINSISGCGHPLFDSEGRILRFDFDDLSVISAYFPSGTSGDLRQNVKYDFLDFFFNYTDKLKLETKNLVICGDYNICHKEIDIHDPKGNKNSSGFLPEERAWMDKWFNHGWHDAFRIINPNPHEYTWWSYRSGARARNKGWRIDYISISENLKNQLRESKIVNSAVHSDHCPMWIELQV